MGGGATTMAAYLFVSTSEIRRLDQTSEPRSMTLEVRVLFAHPRSHKPLAGCSRCSNRCTAACHRGWGGTQVAASVLRAEIDQN